MLTLYSFQMIRILFVYIICMKTLCKIFLLTWTLTWTCFQLVFLTRRMQWTCIREGTIKLFEQIVMLKENCDIDLFHIKINRIFFNAIIEDWRMFEEYQELTKNRCFQSGNNSQLNVNWYRDHFCEDLTWPRCPSVCAT